MNRLQNLEVVYGKLSPDDQALFDEAMAKELVEWVQREAVRQCHNEAERKEAWSSGLLVRARWLLVWKNIPPEEQPEALEKRTAQLDTDLATVFNKEGTKIAKARIVLIGFVYPDLGSLHYKTSSPVAAHTTKMMAKQQATQRH